MAKEYRRFIRIEGRVISSPRFTTKRDADLWYREIKRQKDFGKHGIKVSTSNEITFLEYTRTWIKNRMKHYPQATWSADEQRLRVYLLPEFADVPLSRISSKMIRQVLKGITDSGKAISTRTKVKALASKIFGDAFNEELIPFNPVVGIKFTDPRQGKKKPKYLSLDEALAYLAVAQEMGPDFEMIAVTGLCLGLRKSEALGLKVEDFDFKNRVVTVRRRLEQASLSMKDGTKAGKFEVRTVPMSADAFDRAQRVLAGRDGAEFVFKSRGRAFMSPRTFHDMAVAIAGRAGQEISPHGLRHTFGREFARKGGSIKVLQAILGHSSSSTTDRYSELSGSHLEGLDEVLSYGVKSKVES